MKVTYKTQTGPKKNGIELTFPGKPEQEARDLMKSNGFRWHRTNKVWYAVANDARLKAAKALCSTDVPDAEKAKAVVKAAEPTPIRPEPTPEPMPGQSIEDRLKELEEEYARLKRGQDEKKEDPDQPPLLNAEQVSNGKDLGPFQPVQ